MVRFANRFFLLRFEKLIDNSNSKRLVTAYTYTYTYTYTWKSKNHLQRVCCGGPLWSDADAFFGAAPQETTGRGMTVAGGVFLFFFRRALLGVILHVCWLSRLSYVSRALVGVAPQEARTGATC